MGRCWSCLHGGVSNGVNNGTSCFGMITPRDNTHCTIVSFFIFFAGWGGGGGCNDDYK